MTDYEAKVELPFKLPTPVYGAMIGLWHLRPYLQKRFPLQLGKQRDYQQYLSWCALHGRREYKVLQELPAWDTALSSPAELPDLKKDPYGEMFTTGMCLLGVARYNEFLWPLLCNAGPRRRLWQWYWRELRSELNLPIPLWQLSAMGRFYNFSMEKLLVDLVPVWQRKKMHDNTRQYVTKYSLQEIENYFAKNADISTSEYAQNEIGKTDVNAKCEPIILSTREWRTGKQLSFLSHLPYTLLRHLKVLRSSGPEIDHEKSIVNLISEKPKTGSKIKYSLGVNLIGYAKGELGQGEDLRMLAQTLEHAKIPFCVIDVRPGNNISQDDDSVNHLISEQPKFGINIFCMTGIESLRFYLENGSQIFEGRYSIGLWPWELPLWPNLWSHVYSLVDEIWGISEFTSKAYRNAPVPVTTMPLPVAISPISSRTRLDFALPEETYLFIYSFDLSSTLSRKNPEAIIDAFHLAFPNNCDDAGVGLVLKINNIEKRNKQWRAIKQHIADDSRIIIIEESFRKADVLALYKCCDCFVSLHRSEGFGRSIVESLMLGLKVITTAYSGNMDYADTTNVFLVDYDLRALEEEEYFLSHEQQWAEPSISHAAKHMQQLRKESTQGMEPSEPFERFLPVEVSQEYKQRLELIFENNKV